MAAIEGFYGPPLAHDARLDLIRWLPTGGLNAYSYGPKDDPYHRERWRDLYPASHLAAFEETLDAATSSGVQLVLTLSPGLDWHEGDDEEALVRKLRQLYDLGVRNLGVLWDDLPPGGEEFGRVHGRATAAAVRGLPDDVRWMTVGVDYATSHVTRYLRGFADALPPEVTVAWTGPSITSPEVSAAEAARFFEELGRPVFFGDNFPVNDLGMSPVLHLGPAPERDADLRDLCAGVGFNFMSRPLASRIGLEVSARHWNDPSEDRHAAWEDAVAKVPGLGPLARSCRSWLTDPGPDPELRSWIEPALNGDDRLLEFLAAGCRAGLDPAWQEELDPWLTAWEAEAKVIEHAIHLGRGAPREGFDLTQEWPALHRQHAQVFGIRFAIYAVIWRMGDLQLPDPSSVVRGGNLTDELVHAVLNRFRPPA